MTRKAKLETAQGLLLSLLFILTGSQNWEIFPVISWINIIFGVILLFYSLFFVRKGRGSLFKLIMILLQGVALLLTASMFFAQEKKYLPYAMLLAAAICFIGAVIIFKKRKRISLKEPHDGE